MWANIWCAVLAGSGHLIYEVSVVAEGRCRRCCCRACRVDIGLYLIACFLGAFLCAFGSFPTAFLALFKQCHQRQVALPGRRITGYPGCKRAHFALPVKLDELVQNVAHLKPVAFNAFMHLG